ncbi:MAG: PilZ domain-containing protein [Woeseiaceae bacterium]|nr:PilZ domain-containing protein [Woeseiaceae bacterium]
MTDVKENRRSFRITESAYVKYTVLDDKQFAAGLEHYRLATGQSESAQAELIDIEARLGEACFRLGPDFDAVNRVITLLNDKLNIVIQQLPGLRESKAALIRTPPLGCEISADGMAFPAQKPPAEGAKLHLQILLASDNRYVETFAKVVRHTEVPPGNDGQQFACGVAVEFTGMKAAEREILIQHMFNRESETLRMRRLKLDSMD